MISSTHCGWCSRLPAGRLFAAFLLTLHPVTALAQFTCITNNGTIIIIGYTGSGGAVNIPNTINGLPVVGIGDHAFEDKGSLVSVTIPDSVTSIGFYAFQRCANLTNVAIGNGVTSIGGAAFDECSRLTSVLIPNSVTTIGEAAFLSSGLTKVMIGNGVTFIGYGAFAECHGLTSVSIPNARIHTSAFYNCTGLTNVVLGNGVPSIGEHAFAGCSALTSVTIGTGVTNIGDAAFSYCYSLTAVTIPHSVRRIGHGVFNHCPTLIAIAVDTNNPAYSSLDGVLFNQDRTKLVRFPAGKVGSYTIPDSVTDIEDWAFSFCYGLAAVTVGNRVTEIGDQAFTLCFGNLTSVYFKANAPTVGFEVFVGDNNATVYYLPGDTGWSSTFGGRPTALWLPQIMTSDESFGVQTNQFGFNISWASGRAVVVEASPDLGNPIWSPLATNNLTGDKLYFSDLRWTNYPARFYRIRSP